MGWRLLPIVGLGLAAACGGSTVPPHLHAAGFSPGRSGSNVIAEFRIRLGIGSAPFAIAAGNDGAMWFTEEGSSAIGRIDAGGRVRHYPLPTRDAQPRGIVSTGSGDLYFAEHAGPRYATHVARITLRGRITEWNDSNYMPAGVTPGAGGSIWFTQNCGGLAQLSHGKVNQYPLPGIAGETTAIVRAPDGTVWFAEDGTARIGRIDARGQLTIFAGLLYDRKYNDLPNAVTVGPDGNLWWTALESNLIWATDLQGRIVHEYPVPTPGSQPWGITAGSDGALWFTEWSGNKIGRVTTQGVFSEFPLPTQNAQPQGIARALDGSLWFVETSANQIGRIVV
ncbi:MAG: Virginiamycin B lyase [Candidatus Eremiobacteraeota bacterium]|nr:Virginiamycin B lyase [Candidatus Eremiobacteraeota bacterium]